jgi:hypothetical protein
MHFFFEPAASPASSVPYPLSRSHHSHRISQMLQLLWLPTFSLALGLLDHWKVLSSGWSCFSSAPPYSPGPSSSWALAPLRAAWGSATFVNLNRPYYLNYNGIRLSKPYKLWRKRIPYTNINLVRRGWPASYQVQCKKNYWWYFASWKETHRSRQDSVSTLRPNSKIKQPQQNLTWRNKVLPCKHLKSGKLDLVRVHRQANASEGIGNAFGSERQEA